MIRIKKNLWRSFGMSALMTGALAFAAPALASPANAEHAHMKKMGANEGVTSAGKLSATDAHALWLLHKISKGEIAQAELAQTKAKNDKVKDLAGDLRDDHQKMDENVLKLAQENNVQFAGEAIGTGGSGMEGSSTGMTQDTGSATTPETKPEDQGASTAATGGSSTVEEIPNNGTGGSGTGGSGKMAGAGSMHAGMGQATPLSSADQSLLASGAAQLEKLQGLEGAEFDRTFVRDQVKDHQTALSMLRGVTAQNDDVKGLLKDSISTLEKHEKDSRDALKELRGVGGSGDEGSGMSQPSDQTQTPEQTQTPDQTQPAPTP
jgi:predicted outer membrane protein